MARCPIATPATCRPHQPTEPAARQHPLQPTRPGHGARETQPPPLPAVAATAAQIHPRMRTQGQSVQGHPNSTTSLPRGARAAVVCIAHPLCSKCEVCGPMTRSMRTCTRTHVNTSTHSTDRHIVRTAKSANFVPGVSRHGHINHSGTMSE